jgi:fatty acid desaturase
MEDLEKKGTTFQDKQRGDVKARRYLWSALAAGVMVILMAAVMALLLWAFLADPVGAPPVPVMVGILVIPTAVILGVLLALSQRWREIHRGEEEDAKKY